LDVQQLYQLHLLAGSGAPVEVLEGDKVKRGKWLVSKDDFLVELPDDDAGPGEDAGATAGQAAGARRVGSDAVRAEVRVFLDTGIHTFTALLKRVKGGQRRVVRLGPVRVLQKRKAVRVPVGGELTYRWVAEGENKQGRGRVRDLCPGGVGFAADAELAVGDQVDIAFEQAPWAELGPLEGTVVWKQAQGDCWSYGVAFHDTREEQTRRIVHLLADHLAKRKAKQQEHAR
jgi:hypothetical protein